MNSNARIRCAPNLIIKFYQYSGGREFGNLPSFELEKARIGIKRARC